MTSRAPADGLKFSTPFGAMFVHAAKRDGKLVSVQISHQMKDPEARVSELVAAINAAMREVTA